MIQGPMFPNLKGLAEVRNARKVALVLKWTELDPCKKYPRVESWPTVPATGGQGNCIRGGIGKLVPLPGTKTLEAITLREHEAWPGS